MGVPAFFSWLIKRYPLIISEAKLQEMPSIDCLYLDMNGILYKCAREEKVMFKDLLMDKNFNELWCQIFNYINNIVNSVGPTKILFLGLDGPAPRAKQNQQRSRRFQSAKGYAELTKSLQNCGLLGSDNTFKNNSISPGTDFMHELNEQLKFFIARKFKEDEKWKNLKVVFSGSNVPGEGEHKILSYMRQYSSSENYDPKTTHCIYGADADLIMLGLTTHIPYVSILREVIPPAYLNKISPAAKRELEKTDYQIIYLNVLREYMDLEFSQLKGKFKHLEYNIDSIIDDFVLLCFFVGNDFLPKCYCFDIRQGHIEDLLSSYKEMIVKSTAYINNKGQINWKSMEILLEIMSSYESRFIQEKSEEIDDTYNKNKWYKYDDVCDDNEESDDDEETKVDNKNADTFGQEAHEEYEKQQIQLKKEKAKIIKGEKEFLNELASAFRKDEAQGRKMYYKEKLDFDLEKDDDVEQLQLQLQKYLEGIQFVCQYYYLGCPSWSWYYPFYYSPMATDLLGYVKHHNNNNESLNIKFDKGKHYEPLKQLMCILHPENASLLPQEFSKFLTDQKSPLRYPYDYYPEYFKIDPYGGVWDHEFIISLPFLPEEVLDKVYEQIDMTKLTPYEISKNQLGQNIVFSLNDQPNAKKTKVTSTLPYYTDFDLPLESHSFSLDQMIQCTVKPLEIEKFDSQKIHIFPSLYTKNIQGFEFRLMDGRDFKYNRLFLKLAEEVVLPPIPPKDFIKVYSSYPCCEKGYIVGWMDEKQLYKVKQQVNIKLLQDLRYNKNDHADFFDKAWELSTNILQEQGITMLDTDSQRKVVFIRYYNSIERTLNGNVEENQDQYEEYFYMSTILSNSNRMIKRCEIKNFKNIKEEFPLNSNVLVFDKKYLGYKGTVQDYKKDTLTTLVKVKLTKEPYLFSQDQISKLTRDTTPYYTLKYIAEELDLDPKVLLNILDEVVITLDEEKESCNKLKKKIDIGLKFISRYNNTIVPELVRVPDGVYDINNLYEKYNQFQKLEISIEGTQIIRKFYDKVKHTNLFQKVLECARQKQRPKMRAIDLFDVDPKQLKTFDPNIEIVQIYVWIMQNCNTSLPLCPVNGQVMPKKTLDQFLKRHKKPIYTKETNLEVWINPNHIQKQCDYVYIPFYFNGHPYNHEIGDRVININSVAKPNVPPFGAIGTVIGVINTSIQVFFDQPFIGGTNLGGKCPWLRGATLDFLDIFNLEGDINNTWEKFLTPRDDKDNRYGWDRKVQPPQLQTKNNAIENAEQNQSLVTKFKHDNPFENLENKNKKDIQDGFTVAGKPSQIQNKQNQNKKVVYKQKQSEQQQLKPQDLSEIEAQIQGINVSDLENQNQQGQQIQQTKGQLTLEEIEKKFILEQQQQYEKEVQKALEVFNSLKSNSEVPTNETQAENQPTTTKGIDLNELEKQLSANPSQAVDLSEIEKNLQ